MQIYLSKVTTAIPYSQITVPLRLCSVEVPALGHPTDRLDGSSDYY